MTSASLFAIKVLLLTMGGLCGLLAAVFTLAELWQNEKHDSTRRWFGARWVQITESRWMQMPERVISWAVMLRDAGARRIARLQRISLDWYTGLCFVPFLLVCVVPSYDQWRLRGEFVYWVTLTGMGCMFYAADRFEGDVKAQRICASIMCGLSFALMATMALLWVAVLLTVSIWLVVPLAVIGMPGGLGAIYLATMFVRKAARPNPADLLHDPADPPHDPTALQYALVLSTSFPLTLSAMLVGHIADPAAWIPRTATMLGTNVLCDMLTIWTAVVMFEQMHRNRDFRKIPAMLIFITAVAAILAFCSLGFGLAFTPRALSLVELGRVFIALSPDGGRWEIGPYFWTMHTTFLPVLLYLSVVFVCWIGKALALIAEKFFGKGYEHKNPLKLTAALFSVLAALFGLLAVPINAAQDYAEKREQALQTQSTKKPISTYESTPAPLGVDKNGQ